MKADELAFFGKIAASVTHELKNVLAIINESNGLMGDILGMQKGVSFPHREKFERSIKKVEEQVRRGVEITSRFNRFAHSMDLPMVDADLNSIVIQTLALAQRFAALKNVELKGAICDREIKLSTNAFRIQMALTRAIEAFLHCIEGSGSICMTVQEGPGDPGLSFCFEGECCGTVKNESVEKIPEWRDFEELASILDIRHEWRPLEGSFVLSFPGKG